MLRDTYYPSVFIINEYVSAASLLYLNDKNKEYDEKQDMVANI